MNAPAQTNAPTTTTTTTPSGSSGLKQGSFGWVLLAGLGVSFVISGDFAGWQFGLAPGGWGGLFIALFIVAIMYTTMCLVLAELSAALPSAGGGYLFATEGLGGFAGFATAMAILLEYVIAPAAISTFIGSYIESLNIFGLTASWPVYLGCYVIFVAAHLAGAGEALKAMFVVTAIAIVALIVYTAVMVPHVHTSAFTSGSPLFHGGAMGVWAAIPFAIWFFLAIEGVPMAAEEAKDPAKSVPRAIIVAMAILAVAAITMMIAGPGAAGTGLFAESGNPLVAGLEAVGASRFVVVGINYAALLGLIASFFSIVYAYSRMTFSLARSGLLPRFLASTNRRGAPVWALIIPAIIGFALTLFISGDDLMSIAVFGAVISYALMMASHIALRIRRPEMPRPYSTPGGIVTSSVALILAVGAIVATFFNTPELATWAAGILVIACIGYALFKPKDANPMKATIEDQQQAGAELF